MNVFDPFLSDPNVAAILRHYGAAQMQAAALVRKHAILLLADAVKRVPREAPHIVAAYRAKGIEPTWELGNDDDAVTFTLALRDFDPTPNELHAAALLRACVAANEAGEVTPLTNMRLGQTFRAGRKVGTVGSVRLAVRKVLKRSPGASAAQVWSAIKAKPPKGMTFYETQKLGKYIQSDGAPDTGYGRFATIVSEEKNPKPNQK